MLEFYPFHKPLVAARPLILLFLRIGTLLGGISGALAESVTLAWNPNPEANIAGYEVHYGTLSGQLNTVMNVGNSITANLEELEAATTYYCAVLAYDTTGLKSPLSAQISFTTRSAPVLQVMSHTGAPLDWGDAVDLGIVNLGAMSEMRTFTVVNIGGATVNGLELVLRGPDVASFAISDGFPITKTMEINGSFESLLTTWTVAGNVGADTSQGASDGQWAAVFSSGDSANSGTLSRTLPTIPGATYSLTFDVGVLSNNTNEQRLQTRVTGKETLLTDTAILNGAGGGSTIWSPRSLVFVADSNSTTLSFADLSNNTGSIDLVLDNVRVTEQVTAASGGTVISSLAPGRSARFSIAFQPVSAGNRTAILSFAADPDKAVLFEMKILGSGNAFLESWLANMGVADDPAGNPDGDALNNLLEFAFGTDPAAALGKPAVESGGSVISRGSPTPRIVTNPSFEFRGQFGRRENHESAGLIYRPQFSADLITWVDANATPVLHADDGEIEIVSVASPADIDGQTPRFFRVGVDRKRSMSFPEWLDQHEADGGTNGNPDGDALNNFFEFAFGTNPAVAQGKSAAEVNGLVAARGAPAVRVNGSQGAPDFEFNGLFCRRKDRDSQGLIYKPQFSADLMTWVDAGELPQVRADDGEIEVCTVRAPSHINGMTPRFFRVGVGKKP